MDFSEYRQHLDGFINSEVAQHTLALVYGRRRIGKSTMLESLAHQRGGFYWEATRAEPAVQLVRLGAALGSHLGVGPIALDSWDAALAQLLRLGADRELPVVLDEFGHLLESDRSIDSVVATALGPGGRRANPGRTRLILCGSAIAMMSTLTAGQAPLRGRAGLELLMQPHHYREAAAWLRDRGDLPLALRVYAVIGGVVGYATDMVDHDLPTDRADFPRWVARRVLSPAATLHHEATTLLAEDPTLATGSPVTHHSILGAIATGAVTAGTIAKRLGRAVPRIDPSLQRLIAAGFVARLADPIRAQRPTYLLTDPYLQFHYAVLEPHRSLLRDREPAAAWEQRLAAVFDSQVRGPVFEEQARQWVRRYADPATLGGPPDHVGPSTAVVDGVSRELDVLVATGDPAAPPAERTVTAIGEAKAGETVGTGRLTALERARAALGVRAAGARLLLFAPEFTPELRRVADRRADLSLVDPDRLYHAS